MKRQQRKSRLKKIGQPPGSLVHIGETKVETPVATLIEYGANGFLEHRFSGADDLQRWQPTLPQVWLNLHGLNNPGLMQVLGERFALHPLVLEDILNTDQRPKMDVYPSYIYLVLHHFLLDKAEATDLVQEQISLVLGKDFILSFQERPLGLFQSVRERLQKNAASLCHEGVDMLAYSLLDAVVDQHFSLIETFAELADGLEEEILAVPQPKHLQEIHYIKRQAAQLRRNLWPLREVLGSLVRNGEAMFRPSTGLYLRDVHDHTMHILESLEDLRELATSLQDIYLSSVSHRVNLEVRQLTVVTTVFMPASVIAGIFGMNFHLMPWLAEDDGFLKAMALMGSIAVVMLVIFLRRRWV